MPSTLNPVFNACKAFLCGIQRNIVKAHIVARLPCLFCCLLRLIAGKGGFLRKGYTPLQTLPNLRNCCLTTCKHITAKLCGDLIHINDRAEVITATLQNAGEAALTNTIHTADDVIYFHVSSSTYSIMSPGWQFSALQSLAIDRWSRPPVPFFIAVSVACPSIFSFRIRYEVNPFSSYNFNNLSYLIGIIAPPFFTVGVLKCGTFLHLHSLFGMALILNRSIKITFDAWLTVIHIKASVIFALATLHSDNNVVLIRTAILVNDIQINFTHLFHLLYSENSLWHYQFP